MKHLIHRGRHMTCVIATDNSQIIRDSAIIKKKYDENRGAACKAGQDTGNGSHGTVQSCLGVLQPTTR